ncbi:MAG: integrase core domain-containing protein [Sulfurovum sp.]|nr:integrase core domain-containing protein [Sulfurovum sp.]
MISKEANRRYKIVLFYQKYGLEATLEAFDISKRTLYRYQAILKESKYNIQALEPKSKAPKQKRTSTVPQEIVTEIKRLREKYPNLGKAKLYHLLKPWCQNNSLSVISESTIGRIIAKDKDKMRITPYRIDRNGKVKPKKRKFKNRKPKNLKAKPMHLWAVDTIQKVSDGIRRYIMTLVDPNSRIAFAVAIPTKHTKHTSKVLEALIDGLTGTIEINAKPKQFAILSDNGSEFMKEFETLLQEKGLTHYWTYPRNPKMNAHNERFNRTIQEQFVDYNEDLLFTDIVLFNQRMADWLIDYNTLIPHHSLNMKNPVQYLIENHRECQMLWTNTIS